MFRDIDDTMQQILNNPSMPRRSTIYERGRQRRHARQRVQVGPGTKEFDNDKFPEIPRLVRGGIVL